MRDTQDNRNGSVFREHCYESYVSSFKAATSPPPPLEHPGYRHWLITRYWRRLSELPPDEPVLELGCGTGQLLEFLRQQGLTNVKGIDVSAEQIRLAKARGCCAEQEDAIEALASCQDRYAAILAIDFIEHFEKPELLRLLCLVHASLKPGGIFLLQTPNGSSFLSSQIVHDDLTHATILGPESLSQLLRMAGFIDIQIAEAGPVPWGIRGMVRTALWAGIRACANLIKRIESGRTQAIWSENMICCCRKNGV